MQHWEGLWWKENRRCLGETLVHPLVVVFKHLIEFEGHHFQERSKFHLFINIGVGKKINQQFFRSAPLLAHT